MKPDKKTSTARMMHFIREVYPLQRMINSEGLDRAFEIVKKEIPDTVIHEYPAGMECGDWIVPKGWKVRDAYMENRHGVRIADFNDHPLFVAAYSEPVSGWFTKLEILSHVRCHPTKPGAYFLEHRNAYNYKLVNWGITLPKNTWNNLPDEDYYIHIDVEWSERSMKVAEVFIPGQSEDVISISAHIDEICNDNLSGCAAGIEMIRYIQNLARKKYSYQLLLVPETIGTFFYVYNNLDRVRKTIGMYNLETVGSGESWVLKKALTPNSRIEAALTCALQNTGLPYRPIDFFDGYGNDERVYEWPTLKIPGVALQRFPFHEYHSSDDTPDNIDENHLFDAVRISCELIDVMEHDYVPEYTSVIPPWLTRHDLYYDSKDNVENFHKFNNLLLFHIDGHKPLSELCRIARIAFCEAYEYLERFAEKGFIIKK
jgi:aminopeptidase-like protein